MKITDHFDSDEFDCNDGTPYPNDLYDRLDVLCNALELVRKFFNARIDITSGYRTKAHNKKIGGKPHSKHLEGIAADFKVSGYKPSEVVEIMESYISIGKIPKGGLHAYDTFVHYDIRGENARW